MKEILKYLRSVNSYSQEKVSEAIGLSRQSYNKYEAGTVIPSDKIVNKLAKLYNVSPEFIKNNQIPQLTEPESKIPPVQTYRAVYRHGKIIPKDTELNFPEGQELLITVRAETEEEEWARKEKAWQVIEDFIGNQKATYDDSDPFYDKLRWEALNEKYGPF